MREGEERREGRRSCARALSVGSQCYVDICGTLLGAYHAMLHVAYFHMSLREGAGVGGVASHNHNELN